MAADSRGEGRVKPVLYFRKMYDQETIKKYLSIIVVIQYLTHLF